MALSVVQSDQFSADPNSTTISSNALSTTNGNALVVFFRQSGNLSLPTVTDTAGNTFTGNGQADISGASADAITHYYAYNITGNASNVVTLTWASPQNFRAIFVFEVAGMDYSGGDPLDQVVVTRQSSSASITSSSFTTTQADEIIFMGCGTNSTTATYTEGSGYSPSPPLTATSKDAAVQYKIVSSIQTGVTASMSADASVNWGSVVSTFKGTSAVRRWLFGATH